MTRAAKICSALGCPNLQPCADHPKVAWEGSSRRADLPNDWSSRIVPRILARDPVCQLGIVCRGLGMSTEVHHVGDRHDHRDANLAGVCRDCHRVATSEQAAASRRAREPAA